MDFMGVLSPPAAARDQSQVHAAARALPPPPHQSTSVVVDGHMPPPAAVASLTLQFSGGAHDIASLATSPRSTTVSETTEQLTIFYAGSMLVFDNIPREKAEEIMFFAAKTTPDAGRRQVRQQQLQLQLAAAIAYPNKRQRTFWDQAHERDADGLFVHKNKASACLQQQHRSPENGHAIIKETKPCSSQIQIVPRADVSLLVRNASLVSFLERRKQRLASAAVAYPRREKSPDEKDTFPTASPRNKTPLDNMERHWAFTNAKNINGDHDEEALDTELKI